MVKNTAYLNLSVADAFNFIVFNRHPTSQPNQSSQEVLPKSKSSTSTALTSRFRLQPEQFNCTFRQHIHRRSHAHLLSSQHLNDKCQRDLYICLLQLLHNLSEDPLAALLRSFTSTERADFLKLLT